MKKNSESEESNKEMENEISGMLENILQDKNESNYQSKDFIFVNDWNYSFPIDDEDPKTKRMFNQKAHTVHKMEGGKSIGLGEEKEEKREKNILFVDNPSIHDNPPFDNTLKNNQNDSISLSYLNNYQANIPSFSQSRSSIPSLNRLDKKFFTLNFNEKEENIDYNDDYLKSNIPIDERDLRMAFKHLSIIRKKSDIIEKSEEEEAEAAEEKYFIFFEYLIKNKIEKFDVNVYKSFKGNFVEILKTQNGSRIIQKMISNSDNDYLGLIVEEIKDSLPCLLKHSYANYALQKLFNLLPEEVKETFIKSIINNIDDIGKHKIGTYSIQGIIENIRSKEHCKIIVDKVKEDLIGLSMNTHSTHIIEKIVPHFPDDILEEIKTILLENFISLSENQQSLCVIKKFIIKETGRHKKDLEIISIIKKNFHQMIQNPFANYAIQTMIEVNFI
jgi:hypothetical protein